ncbi:MAG: response regulator transcription factor, partial [Blastocatellia bacterium]
MSDPQLIRVILVDDHPVVRFGLAAIIGLQPDMLVVGEVGSGEEACSLCSKHPADIVLMDLR